ncbi:MAG: hypothetical protein FJ083_14275 [Cyanobacteria bacterium K_Offshore_surface_m2_239]|nr:hypothetical protein [Cyanobacteria bacterium K_Offshore_surface_m2_239]
MTWRSWRVRRPPAAGPGSCSTGAVRPAAGPAPGSRAKRYIPPSAACSSTTSTCAIACSPWPSGAPFTWGCFRSGEGPPPPSARAPSTAAERVTVFYGRPGRPMKKPRFIPAERTHHWARKLQARRMGTVSVVWSHQPAAASATKSAAAGLRCSGAASWTSGGMPTLRGPWLRSWPCPHKPISVGQAAPPWSASPCG